MTVSLVWAEARDGVIGDGGGIPWHLPEDLARFRALTSGATVIMGRKTWDSLPERFRPLPGRRNIVITRRADWSAEGAVRASSIPDALAGSGTDVWVIGGGEVYQQALTVADRLEVTEVDLEVRGDTRAPAIDGRAWRRVTGDDAPWQLSRTGIRYRFATYTRR